MCNNKDPLNSSKDPLVTTLVFWLGGRGFESQPSEPFFYFFFTQKQDKRWRNLWWWEGGRTIIVELKIINFRAYPKNSWRKKSLSYARKNFAELHSFLNRNWKTQFVLSKRTKLNKIEKGKLPMSLGQTW